MQNLDIRDFPTVSSVDDQDHAVLSMFSGISAKMKLGMFRRLVAEGITPVIGEDGQWYIGTDATGVDAEGLTPEFRRGASGIEFKYTKEGDSTWRTLLVYSDVKMKWEDFTEEQIDSLKLHYEDLTEEDIAELQQPATEAAEQLAKTEKTILESEAARVEAEALRVSAESLRKEAENKRDAAEYLRERGEQQRMENETARGLAEQARVTAEASRATAETAREKAEQARVKQEELRVLSEQERVDIEQQRMNEFQTIKKTLGDQSQTISMDDDGNIIITFGAETNFSKGYIEDDGDVVLEFEFE